jgi:hypothetical protein
LFYTLFQWLSQVSIFAKIAHSCAYLIALCDQFSPNFSTTSTISLQHAVNHSSWFCSNSPGARCPRKVRNPSRNAQFLHGLPDINYRMGDNERKKWLRRLRPAVIMDSVEYRLYSKPEQDRGWADAVRRSRKGRPILVMEKCRCEHCESSQLNFWIEVRCYGLCRDCYLRGKHTHVKDFHNESEWENPGGRQTPDNKKSDGGILL